MWTSTRPWHGYLPDTAPDGVTVRRLLSHTSGLPNPTVVGPARSLEEGVAGIEGLPPAAEPGTSYLYSDLNYWMAALIVERVSGRDFTCVAPALAVFLFLVAPALQDNSYVPVDVFWLFPALAVLVGALGVVGAGLTTARAAVRTRTGVAGRR